jgi:prephenate dehydratase
MTKLAKNYSKTVRLFFCRSFSETIKALKDNKADKAILAIENSLYGSINEVYDLILKNNFWISAETYLKISLSLIGLKDTKIADIKEVHSHPVALAECEEFIDENLSGALKVYNDDTVTAVRDIARYQDASKAAIASPELAGLNNLSILADDVEINPNNYTRFVVVEREMIKNEKADKTSIVLRLAERSGVLYEALGLFSQRDINLTKLESRPIINEPWAFMFYIDYEAGLHNSLGLLDDLKVRGSTVHVLGCYEKADLFKNISESL